LTQIAQITRIGLIRHCEQSEATEEVGLARKFIDYASLLGCVVAALLAMTIGNFSVMPQKNARRWEEISSGGVGRDIAKTKYDLDYEIDSIRRDCS
jgi:hypothetical protein